MVEDISFSVVHLDHVEFQHVDLTPLLGAEHERVLLCIVVSNGSSDVLGALLRIDDLTRLHYS